MKLEIENNNIRMTANGRSLIIHHREEDGVEIISFQISDGQFAGSGKLPDVEFSKRDALLRHIGNRIEQVR